MNTKEVYKKYGRIPSPLGRGTSLEVMIMDNFLYISLIGLKNRLASHLSFL